MKPVTKSAITIVSPQGFLDGNNTDTFLTVEDMNHLSKATSEMILVSLKKVIFFNKNGLESFVRFFAKLRKQKSVIVGFCDYDKKKYDTIVKYYGNNLHFSLFKSAEIAYLFTSSFKNESKNVLLWIEDKSQRAALAIELHNNGHNPIIAQNEEDYIDLRRAKDRYDAIIELSFLGQMGQKIGSRVSGNAIIYSVSSYLDNSIISSFNKEYHDNSLRVGFRLFIFDAFDVISMNVHALNFFSKLSSAAAEYNATLCFVGLKFDKTPIVFKNTLEDAGIMFFEHMDDILKNKELLDELGAGTSANVKNLKTINKKNILELPSFIDAAVSTLEMMTNAKAIKKSVELTTLNLGDPDGKIASSIGYYGSLDGMVVLIFPTAIAKKACELLIGEQTDDLDLILDTLAELVNIVGGKIKTLLADRDISVDITLPRTYKEIADLCSVIGERKGALVELEFSGDKFVFFLTR